MPVDNGRFRDLIARAAFDCSFYKGTWQDLSSAKRVMSAVGAPTWGRVNGLPCLTSSTGGGVTSGNLPPAVDITGNCAFECCFRPTITDSFVGIMRHQVAAGGWLLAWNIAGTSRITLYYYTAGGAATTTLTTLVAHPAGTLTHAVISSTAGVPTSLWVRGVPTGFTLVNGGGMSNAVLAPFLINRAYAGGASALIARAYPFALTNEDATCLASQAELLCGGWS